MPSGHKRQSQTISLPGHSVAKEKRLCVLPGDCLPPQGWASGPSPPSQALSTPPPTPRQHFVWEGKELLPDIRFQDNSSTCSVLGRPGGGALSEPVRALPRQPLAKQTPPKPPAPRAQPPWTSPVRWLPRLTPRTSSLAIGGWRLSRRRGPLAELWP